MIDEPFTVYLEDENAMVAFGQRLGAGLRTGIIHLSGDLGAGKTTLCRGILRARGHAGAVKSPTFTLVEPYDFDDGAVFHFDLYRLVDGEELEYMGIRDYVRDDSLCIIEWPEKGGDHLGTPDLDIRLSIEGRGRGLVMIPLSDSGRRVVAQLHGD
ncbi:MAG: tRNA (adenosine(37)-N6)-threonylcarbamoyltransferase complex ATPase subunit type 1 TsaE [Bacteroidales bacterium]|nr:tRNA (adenosine(37)-N6)-threonylcarbamoyltransferase complex ATPase subunit type 1 TsaE [Bacteroidales bacterium]